MTEYRIVTAKYDPSGVSVTDPIYKGNYGNILRLVDFPEGMVPETFEMHFSVGGGIAKTQIGTNNEVKILDECLTKVVPITAWLFLHDAATDGETKYEIRIPVKPKDNVTDAEPTPVEQSVITQAIAALNTGVERAETAADAAEDAQEDAETAADRAEQAATDAQSAAQSAAEDAAAAVETELAGYTQDAQDAATRAANSATDANSSREAADVSATAAGVSERNAATSATAAAGSASAAAQSATTASQKAEEAAGYAESISGSVDAAQTAAQTATAKAGESSQSASTAAQKAQEAASSATSASQSASAANTAKTQAETAKNDAVTAKNAAQTAATNAAGSAQTAQDVADSIPADYDKMIIVSNTQPVNETHNKIWIKTAAEEEYTIPTYEEFEQVSSAINELPDIYAKQDEEYENLTSGNALEVLSDRGTSDTEPYLFRKALGWNRAMVKAVTGGSLPWNQLIQRGYLAQGITAAKTDNGHYVLSGTATSSWSNFFGSSYLKVGHRYLAVAMVVKNPNSLPILMNANNNVTSKINSSAGIYFTVQGSSATAGVGLGASGLTSGTDYTGIEVIWNLFDITLMFGSAVADYFLTLEQASAGSAISLFRSWFPNDYYEYNPGELISVSGLQSRETVGFNQWDEEWELGAFNSNTGAGISSGNTIRSKNRIPVVGSTGYCARSGLYSFWYDENDNFIEYIYYSGASTGYNVVTSPSNARYMRFYVYGTTYNHNICINISDPSRNGTYKPYVKHSYPLDSSVALRGVPKLVDNKLAFDGDRYLPDGTVQRRYGVVGLSTIPVWNSDAVSSAGYIRFITPNAYLTDKKEGYNLICDKLTASDTVVPSQPNAEMISGYSGGKGVYIAILASKLSGDLSTANGRSTAFVNYLANNEITIVYELATPTIETTEPYRNLQIQEKGGTEAFVSNAELPVPVGHETFYPINIFDYIDQAIAATLNS